MSSHHIVRDEQEPALLIMDPSACPADIIGQLLEWSPVVATTSTALKAVLETGIKVDLVIYTSAEDPEMLDSLLTDQQPVRLLESSGNFPAHNLLQFLHTKGQPSLNIVSHLPPEELLPTGIPLQGIALFCGSYRGIYQATGTFEKWAGAGQQYKAALENSDKKLYNLLAAATETTVLEVLQDGFIRIESSGPFWLWEKIA